MQVSDVAVGWLGHEKAFYGQPYFIAILYKAIRHWLGPGLLMPYLNPWESQERHPRVRLRSRRLVRTRTGLSPSFPKFRWGNNKPAIIEEKPGRIYHPLVIRYYRRFGPRLVLREAGGNLMRPAMVQRRPRYAFTMWSRPRMLRVSGVVFCILKGLGAGERTPRAPRPRRWRRYVRSHGLWKKATKQTPPERRASNLQPWRSL